LFKAQIIADGKIIKEITDKEELDVVVEKAYLKGGYGEVYTKIIEGDIE